MGDPKNRAELLVEDITKELSLGGPGDNHYALLGQFQPLLVGREWARRGNWLPGTEYELREALAAIARHRLKNGARDLRKAAWMLEQAAEVVEEMEKE